METLVGEVGNWVEKDRFWGRERELALLVELLVEGANVSIVAQRRIGKTSLMREAGNRLPSGFVVLHLDLQDARDPADMVVKLASATRPHAPLWAKTAKIFANALQVVLDRVESISIHEMELHLRAGLSGSTWQEKAGQLLAALAEGDRSAVLFVDELPVMIHRMLESDAGGKAEVHVLLSWLRAQALAHKGRIRMAFAGSIGFEPVLGRVGLAADINHLTPFLLEPWSAETALGCLSALAAHRGIELPELAARRMLDLLGCNIPHHVQLFFARVRERCLYDGVTCCSPQAVDEIFERRMLGTRGHAELVHMEQRLEMVLRGDDQPLAMDLLTQAAVTGRLVGDAIRTISVRNGLSAPDQARRLPRILDILEHDGYLKPDGASGYVFVSNLLRQWWKARFQAFYQAV